MSDRRACQRTLFPKESLPDFAALNWVGRKMSKVYKLVEKTSSSLAERIDSNNFTKATGWGKVHRNVVLSSVFSNFEHDIKSFIVFGDQ